MAEQPDSPLKPTPVFDLAKAIAEARAEFPEQTKNCTFADLSARDAAQQFMTWFASTSDEYQEKFLHGRDIEDVARDGILSGAFCAVDPVSGKSFVGARSAPLDSMKGIFNNPQQSLGYIFAHELGHLVTPGGIPANTLKLIFEASGDDTWTAVAQVILAENAADSFAAIYGLAKGWLDVPTIARLSARHAAGPALDADFTHFTSIALDRLMISPDMASFVSLRPQDMRDIAARHAEECALDEKQVRDVHQAMRKEILRPRKEKPPDGGAAEKTGPTLQDVVNGLGRIYRKAPRNSLQYYIAQKVLSAAFTTGRLPGRKRPFNVSDGQWPVVRDSLIQRKEDDSAENLLRALALNKADVTQPPLSGKTPAAAPAFTK